MEQQEESERNVEMNVVGVKKCSTCWGVQLISRDFKQGCKISVKKGINYNYNYLL